MGVVVIVGAGQAGFEVAASLRSRGYEGRVALVGAEPRLPYQRPPLSKGVLAGGAADATRLRPDAFFADHDIELLPGERALEIERPRRRVHLGNGGVLRYTHVVLATGGENRRLDVPGIELDGVMSLRTLEDSLELRERLERAEHVAIVGAGFIGLEVAAVASAAGKRVEVFEIADRPMGRVVSDPMSRFFADAHRRNGVRLNFGAGVARIHGAHGRVAEVEGTDGTRRPADVVLVAIGIAPSDGLAAEAGLPVDHGVLVDEHLLTEDPAVFAAGDCARFPCRFSARPVALESVQNASAHARAVADRLCGGSDPYRAVPWFWSDQGDLRLQIAGLTAGADEVVVVGDAASERFSAVCFRDGRLLGVESVGRPADHVAARRLLAHGIPLSPDDARADDFELKAWARHGGEVRSR